MSVLYPSELRGQKCLERVTGFEPAKPNWEDGRFAISLHALNIGLVSAIAKAVALTGSPFGYLQRLPVAFSSPWRRTDRDLVLLQLELCYHFLSEYQGSCGYS